MSDPRITTRTSAYRAARDAWHAHYCGEDRACTPADHCAGAPDRQALQAALAAALPHLTPTRDQIAEALHAHDQKRALIPRDWANATEMTHHTYLGYADAVLALLNGSQANG